MLRQNEIQRLIACPKRVEKSEPATGFNTENRSRRKNLELSAIEKGYVFKVFIRQSTELIENFSIGLIYKSGDKEKGNIMLIRFNGNHGDVDWSNDRHYSSFHIHRITEELLEQGVREPKDIEKTTRYTTFDGALAKFFKEINLENWLACLPELKQISLAFTTTVGGQE